jgi:hypothetical protein
VLDLGLLYFNEDQRLTAPAVFDLFIIMRNSPGLGDRLIEAAGAHLDGGFNSSEINAGHFAGLEGHTCRYHVCFLFAKGQPFILLVLMDPYRFAGFDFKHDKIRYHV